MILSRGLPVYSWSYHSVLMGGGQTGKKKKWSSLNIEKRDGTGDLRVERISPLYMANLTTWGHDEVPARAAAEGHIWDHGHAVAGVNVDVHSSYYH